MLAVTFSGGDKMMRSIVSSCVPCLCPPGHPGDSQDIAPSPPIPTQPLCEPCRCLLSPCRQREGPALSPPGSCPASPPHSAPRTSGSLNNLAPASPLFWHVGLSQLNF